MPLSRTHLCLHLTSMSCIKGHRSTKCNHGNSRQMVQVRPAGRPMTTCCHKPGTNCSCKDGATVKMGIRKHKSCKCGPSSNGHKHSQSYSDCGFDKMVQNGNVHVPIAPAPSQEYSATSDNSDWQSIPSSSSTSYQTSTTFYLPPTPATTPYSNDNGIYHQVHTLPVAPTATPRASCCESKSMVAQELHVAPQPSQMLSQVQPISLQEIRQVTNFQMPPLKTNGTTGISYQDVSFRPVSNSNSHNCNCGDTCECLGCATHPYNATTQQFAKEAYMYSNQAVSDPTTPIVSSFLVDPLPALNDDFSAQSTTSEGKADDTGAFSLENYEWFEYEVGNGCFGDELTCPCGDSCACIACTIHKPQRSSRM